MERQQAPKPTKANSTKHTNLQSRIAPQKSTASHPILQLQRKIGNQAVQRLLSSGGIQAKLEISHPGDQYEQEADRAADQVMRMPEPSNGNGTGVLGRAEPLPLQRAYPEYEEELRRQPEEVEELQSGVEPEEEEEENLQMKEAPGGTPKADSGLDTNINAIHRGGQPLPKSTRVFFERHFGHDFSQVRVHTDSQAAQTARELKARAFTFGEDVVFGEGQYAPKTIEGKRLLAHELVHAVQQRANSSPSGSPDLPHWSDTGGGKLQKATARAFAVRPITVKAVALQIAREADPASIADEVIEKENLPDPIAGVGDYASAFEILSGLDTASLLQVLVILDEKFSLDLLRDHIGAAVEDEDRLETAILAVLYGRRGLTSYHLKRGFERFGSLDADLQAKIRDFLEKNFGTHRRIAFTEGEEAETERLAKLELAFFEEKRKKEEEEAQKRAQAEAKAKGTSAPSKASTVEIGEVLEKEVKSRVIPSIPTDQWDNLSDADKKNWTDKRAPAALSNLATSIKGTELETTMKGHDFKFKPREMLERGGYAYQEGNNLVVGMAFIKDVEKDPKNVWGIIAHEIGGHFEYGETYAKKVMDKVLAKLPEAERKKWTTGKAATEFFDAFLYSETEIFSALRQRRYDVPVSGPAPAHGAIRPDDNIENRLTAIDASYPKEVAQAILIELNMRVQANWAILDRDKKYFLDQVKKHGYSL